MIRGASTRFPGDMEASENKAKDDAVVRLQQRFPSIPQQVIAEEVEERYRKYDHHPVRRYMAVLVEREVSHILRGTSHLAS